MSHQYAPVAPIESLIKLSQMGLLGNYQLLIAPIVNDRADDYHDFAREHPGQRVILDNGVIETGQSVDLLSLFNAAMISNATVVVMPDFIDEKDDTIQATASAIRQIRLHRLSPGKWPPTGFSSWSHEPINLMGVIQGRTLEECLECAEAHVANGVDWLAVPRGLTKNLKSRVQLTVAVAEAYGLPIHVLGFSENLMDDILTSVCHSLVQGIDAATPVWLPERLPLHPSMAGPEQVASWGRRRPDFWEAGHLFHPNVVGYNVETVRRWQKDALTALTRRDELAAQVVPETPSL